jgi:hypothetical protein
LADWGVSVVVVPKFVHTPALFAGDDAAYDAAFMTAAIGRRPRIQDGAWVWYGVDHPVAALPVSSGEFDACDPVGPGRRRPPMAAVTDCVYRMSTTAPPGPRAP